MNELDPYLLAVEKGDLEFMKFLEKQNWNIQC